MKFTQMLVAATLSAGMLSGTAFAQSTTPVAPATPAATAAAAPAMDKAAISKACSDEATKQGLHGKARKTFRSKCKMEKKKGM